MSKKNKRKIEDKSPIVPQRDKIEGSLDIRELQWTENQKKFIGTFIRIYNYNYYSIAIFNNVQYLNSDNKSIITKSFIINDFYNYTHFFIPEIEILLLKQIFRQKIGDDYFIKELL